MGQKSKWFLPFFLGIIAGIMLTILILAVVAVKYNPHPGINMYTEATEPFGRNNFHIFQAFSDGTALAHAGKGYDAPIVLLNPIEGVTYYDNLDVHTPKGKKAMIAGTYEYTTKNQVLKTVPVIVFQ